MQFTSIGGRLGQHRLRSNRWVLAGEPAFDQAFRHFTVGAGRGESTSGKFG